MSAPLAKVPQNRTAHCGAKRRMRWTTRVDPKYTAPFGVPNAHFVAFQPNDDRGGASNVIGVSIPEATSGDIAAALIETMRLQARLIFVCDTRRQTRQIARIAAANLPTHHRVALERAELGRWGSLI